MAEPSSVQVGPAPRVPTLLAFRSRGFGLLWVSTLVESTGRWMEPIVMAWLTLEWTGSAWLASVVLFALRAPGIISGAFGGTLLDRIGRKAGLVGAAFLSLAAALAVLVYLAYEPEGGNVLVLMLVVPFMGLASSLDFAARRAAVRDLVKADLLANALSLDIMASNVSRTIGPIIGGGLLPLLGPRGVFIALSSIYVVSILPLALLPISHKSQGLSPTAFTKDLVEGFRHAGKTKVVLAILLLTIIMNIFYFSLVFFAPVFAKNVLGVGAFLTGVLVGSHGFGAILGSLGAASWRAKRPGLLFIQACLAMLLTGLVFAWQPWYASAVLLLALSGAGFAAYNTYQSGLLMMSSPEAMRGRMMGLMVLGINTGPLGVLMLGALASHLELRLVYSLSILIGLILLLLVAVYTPTLRKYVHPLPESPAGQPQKPLQS